jgi:hypothetical protein
MYNNGFLIVEVSPANKEKSVPINQGMTVRFVMDMDINTISSGTLFLHEVNGESIPVTVTYSRVERLAHVQPNAPLQKGTSYRLTALGGTQGIKSSIGTTLAASREYVFTTTQDVLITAPKNLAAEQKKDHLQIQWLQPDIYDLGKIPYYQVYISLTNLDPDQDPGSVVWPLATDTIGRITQTSVKARKDLDPGSYYIYVRGVSEDNNGAWASLQIVIEEEVVEIPGGSGGGDDTMFDILETFPKNGDVHIKPSSIKVLFTSPIDLSTFNPQSLYILNKKAPSQLSFIDLMTTYGPSNAVPYTIEATDYPNLLSLIVDPTLFIDNQEFTIILRESIKSASGQLLGEAYAFSFTSVYSPLYGDPERIRGDIKGFVSSLNDKALYQYMRDASITARDIVITVQAPTDEEAFFADPPRYLAEYVRTQTDYDLLVNLLMEKSSDMGSSRTLADLSIGESADVDLTPYVSVFKSRIQPWKDQLYGLTQRGYAKPLVTVKGEDVETYPDYFTRDLTDIYE